MCGEISRERKQIRRRKRPNTFPGIGWFARLKSFIETEPALDLSSVFLGEG
jgi:hypothetical protein